MSDEQWSAEQLDEDVILGDDELHESDETDDFPPDHLSGVPFADADVTDESFADRFEQMEPEAEPPDGTAADAVEEVEELDGSERDNR